MKLADIQNFIEGNLNLIRKRNLPSFKIEQAYYRASLCKPCLQAGKCDKCGCATPGMFFATNKTDSRGRWSVMVDEEEWNLFKKENGIVFEDIEKLKNDTKYTGELLEILPRVEGPEAVSDTDNDMGGGSEFTDNVGNVAPSTPEESIQEPGSGN